MTASAERAVVVVNAKGVHARPSASIVKRAAVFQSRVWLERDGQRAEADSILDVIHLAACEGCELTIHAEGPDADEAVAAIADLFATRFGEEK